MATQKKGGVVFRRVRGRVIAIHGNGDNNRADALKLGAAVAIGAAAALGAGRLAPRFGLAAASPKVKKTLAFHAARALGITALASTGVAASYAGRLADRNVKDKQLKTTARNVLTGAVVSAMGTLLPKVAKLGRHWASNMAYKAATRGTKVIGGLP